MARTPWIEKLVLLLVFSTFFMGCTTVRPRHAGHDEGSVAVGHSDEGGSADKARASDVAAALWIAGAFLIVGAVIVDVFILPWAIPTDHVFCCTVSVVVVCYR